jgi:hypothetical protein
MDNIMREGEQALEGQSGGGGGNNNNNMNSGNDQGNMGGGNDNSQGGGNRGGGNMNQQSGGNQSGGGGFMGGLEKTGEDSMMNQGMLQRRINLLDSHLGI